jgi:uncharacterized protein YecT (DUF1311 family)
MRAIIILVVGMAFLSATSPAVRAQSLAVVARGSEKPSFECAQAKTAPARLICADGELARLDGELGAAFQKQKLQLPAADQPKFVANQLAWIRDRNGRCGLVGTIDATIEELAASKPCMVSAIRERIAFLTQSDPAAAAAAAPQQGAPKIKQGMPYSEARAIILSTGWQASVFKKTILNEIERDLQEWFINARLMEIEECAGTGDAFCVAEFHDAEGKRKLYVFTTSGSLDEIRYAGHDPQIVSFCIDKKTVNCEQPMDADQIAALLDHRVPERSASDLTSDLSMSKVIGWTVVGFLALALVIGIVRRLVITLKRSPPIPQVLPPIPQVCPPISKTRNYWQGIFVGLLLLIGAVWLLSRPETPEEIKADTQARVVAQQAIAAARQPTWDTVETTQADRHSYSFTIYYRDLPYNINIVYVDTQSLIRAVLAQLMINNVDPSKTTTMIWAFAGRKVSGETGTPHEQDFGYSFYNPVRDQIEFKRH